MSGQIKRKEAVRIGSVKRDIHASERRYETEYPGLHTSTGVKALLRDYTKLCKNAYDKGDYDALVLLLDCHTAVERAKLTARQREVITLVFIEGLTQEEAGDELGTTQENVAAVIATATRRIAKIYDGWRRMGASENKQV